MPALDQSEVPSTLARAAAALNGENLGVPEDRGLSSGTSVSMLLKASGAEITPTMDIGNLHGQLVDAGWKSIPYQPGDKLRPGDVVLTSLDPQGRNVGIVGEDATTIYSHNGRSGHFEGRTNWSSQFTTIMRAPEK